MSTETEVAMLSFPNEIVDFSDDAVTGDTVFRNVTLLAEGTWTDKQSKKTIFYPGPELAKMQIKGKKVKMVHDIYSQLAFTNEIGVIENERFVTSPTPRWVGDIRIFPTQGGKDVSTLLKRKQITDISPEVFHILTRNKAGTFDSSDIIFMGVAPVRTGACRVCTVNEANFYEKFDQNKGDKENMVSNPSGDGAPGTGKGAGTDKASEVAALEARLADVTKIKEQEVRIEDLKRQVAELEKQPVTQSRKGSRSVHASELDSDQFPAFMSNDFASD